MIAPAFPPTSSWPPRGASRPSPANPASTAPSAFDGPATNACGRRSPPSPITRATPRLGRRRSTPPRVGVVAIIPTRSASWLARGLASCGAAGKIAVLTTSSFTGPPSAWPPHDNSRVDTGCLIRPRGGARRRGVPWGSCVLPLPGHLLQVRDRRAGAQLLEYVVAAWRARELGRPARAVLQVAEG